MLLKSAQKMPAGIGSKAENLIILHKLGCKVPTFIIIPAQWFKEQTDSGMLDKSGTPDFSKLPFPENFEAQIKAEFPSETKYLAVRSSYVEEDSIDHSFAGQFKTKLFVPFEELTSAIVEVCASAFQDHVVAYQQYHNLEKGNFLSVIIQEMVEPDVSGVAFSMNPLTGHRTEKVINSVFGVGEGLVSGDLSADQFLIENGKVTSNIVEKKEQYIFDHSTQKGLQKIQVPLSQQKTPSLNSEMIKELSNAMDKIKAHFGKHQDIEFAFKDNQLFILQSRPITATHHLPDIGGKFIVWDNSNIVESYPGITLPLTYSYINDLYERAYRQFVSLMGVSKREIENNSIHFSQMLGLLNGRVYYNLRSWYKMISLLPGYSFNARFMEQMMGVKERFELNPEEIPSKTKDLFRIVRMIWSIVKNLNTLEKQKRKFKESFEAIENRYIDIDPNTLSADQIMDIYLQQERILLKIWKAPLINDFFAMIYFGLLRKNLNTIFGEDQSLYNDLLIADQGIVTTRPAELLAEMVEIIFNQPEFHQIFKTKDADSILKIVGTMDSGKKLKAILDEYLDVFGDRIVGELKLETVSYKQQPDMLIRVLQSYIRKGLRPISGTKRSGIETRNIAEKKVKEKLRFKPLKRAYIFHVLRRARRLVRGRENLRLYRTRAFGGARKAFLTIGSKFENEGILDFSRDIFYLSKQEIFSYITGTSINYQLKELASMRKKQFDRFVEEKAQEERIKSFGIVYQGNNFLEKNQTIPEVSDSLKGLGCCKGIVRGKVKVAEHPEEALNQDGDILVTKSTDPGWVTVFPSISGILVERGSLLSHAAIVSREMGIPCIVGVSQICDILETGDLVEMDGASGIINIIERKKDKA